MFRPTAKPIHAKTELKHTERGPSIAITADLRPFVTYTGLTVKTALFLSVSVTHSSSMKGPRLNFHAERELAGHLLAVFWYHKLFALATDCLRLALNRQARLPTLNSRNSTTNSNSTHQPTAALQIHQSLSHLETVSPTRFHHVLRSRINDHGKKWSHG